MTDLTLTRVEADRLDTDGRVVLVRDGVERQVVTVWIGGPPDEFTAAAEPCETCGGLGDIEGRNIASWDACHDCLDGKRRITAVTPCDHPHHDTSRLDGGWAICGTSGCVGGVVTVATVVVEWGPIALARILAGKYILGIRKVAS